MALKSIDYFKFSRMLNGAPAPLLDVKKESATTWSKGDVIIASGGYGVEGADGPTTGTIIGVAAEDAVAGQLSAKVIPAIPAAVFKGRLATGDAGGDYTSLVTDRYTAYGISLEAATSNVWYINAADTTAIAVLILDFIDAIGTNLAEVEFVFVDTVFGAQT